MFEVMLDVNGWQGLFDFVSGQPIEMSNKEYLSLPKCLSAKYPYPGDLNLDAIKWVTDFSLSVCREYDPRLMLISYATANILRTNTIMDYSETKRVSRLVLKEAIRFAETAKYKPIIVSTGNMKHIDKIVNSNELEGYLSVSSNPYLGGVFGASNNDFKVVKNMPGVSLELKSDFIERYKINEDYALNRTPDILLHADQNIALTNTGGRGTTLEMMMKKEKSCLVYSPIKNLPDNIFDIRKLVDDHLEKGEKIAVIIVEAIDDEFMPAESKSINRYRNDMYYIEGSPFYYALLNGKEFNESGVPYIFHNPFIKKDLNNRYPFSYIKNSKYQKQIGLDRGFRTASVGTRSGIFHSACMCDYSFECNCRNLTESGVFVFVNGDKLSKGREM